MTDKVTLDAPPGRFMYGAADLIKPMRKFFSKGDYLPGQFLPPLRTLADEFDASYETVRRCLKTLEKEGLVESVPRRGFRMRVATPGSITNRPVAYVTNCSSDMSDAEPTTGVLAQSLQEVAGNRALTMLGVHCGGGNLANLVAQVHAARAWGIVMDTLDDVVAKEVASAGLPVVMVNSWAQDPSIDVVLQDNYLGGAFAAQHMLERGIHTLGWVGSRTDTCHSRERYAGVLSVLNAEGAFMNPEHVIERQGDNLHDEVRALLSSDERPGGLFVFWKQSAQAVRVVASELGLSIGSDLHLIGWCAEELYNQEHGDVFAGCPVPPAVVWRASEMTEAALERLEACKEGSRPRRTCIPVRIQEGVER